MYASGAGVYAGADRSQLVLNDLRPLARGRYMLSLRFRRGRRWITHRSEIAIG